MPEIQRNSTGLSGEYFVAAELYRRGWSVGLTIGNAKAVDLFAEKNGKIITIQVKSIYKRKNNGWPIMKDKIKNGCFYVFVNLNGDVMAPPDFYISTPDEVRMRAVQYETRGVINVSSMKNDEFYNNWQKLEKKI